MLKCVFDDLSNRLYQHGLKSGIKFNGIRPATFSSSFRGFVATETIAKGQIILQFPLSRTIDRSCITKYASNLGLLKENQRKNQLKKIVERKQCYDSDLFSFTLFMLEIRKLGNFTTGDDLNDVYFESLLENFGRKELSFPLFQFNEKESNLLQGTSLYKTCQNERHNMQNRMKEEEIEEEVEEFKKMHGILSSRVFGDGSSAFLYPLADLFNHSHPTTSETEAAGREWTFEGRLEEWKEKEIQMKDYNIEVGDSDCFLSDREFSAGDEVTISYFHNGREANHEYLMRKYGFVDLHMEDFFVLKEGEAQFSPDSNIDLSVVLGSAKTREIRISNHGLDRNVVENLKNSKLVSKRKLILENFTSILSGLSCKMQETESINSSNSNNAMRVREVQSKMIQKTIEKIQVLQELNSVSRL